MNARWMILPLLAALALSVMAGPVEQRDFADGLYARGMYALALKEYRALLAEEKLSDGDTVLYRAAECARQTGQTDQALKWYRQLAVDYPGSTRRHQARLREAALLVEQGEEQQAAQVLEHLVGEKPPEAIAAAAWLERGRLMSRLGNTKEAEQSFKKIIKTWPDQPFAAYAGLGLAELHADDEQQAEERLKILQAAAERSGDDVVRVEVLTRLGHAAYAAGAYQQSADAFANLLKEFPRSKQARQGRLTAGWALYQAGREKEALTLARKARKSDGQQAPAWLYLEANCLRKQQLNAAAMDVYRELVDQYADSEEAGVGAYEAALLAFEQGDYETAAALVEPLNLEGRLRVDRAWMLAETAVARDDTDAAVKHYREIIDHFPEDPRAPEALYRLARLMRLQESWARAAYMYRRMISNYPDHDWVPRALFDTGLCHQSLKKPEQAAESWQQLLDEYPEHELVEETRYRLGLLLAAAGDRKAARNQFEQLLEDYPETAYLAQARYYLGVLLAGEEQWSNAEEQFRKALDEELGEELTGRARFQLADVLRRQEKDQEAADLVQSMLGTDAQQLLSPEYLNWLALYRFEEQDGPSTVEAAEAMLKVASTPEQQQVAALLAGQGMEMEDKPEAALTMYRKAAELSARPRSSGEAALRWGDVALLLEKPASAREAYQRAAAVAENDSLMDVRAKAYLGLGKVAQQQEAWEDAARYLLSVGILYEDETIVPEALYRAATVLDADGLTDDAQKTRAELLEKYPDSEWAERTTAGTKPADNLPGEEPK